MMATASATPRRTDIIVSQVDSERCRICLRMIWRKFIIAGCRVSGVGFARFEIFCRPYGADSILRCLPMAYAMGYGLSPLRGCGGAVDFGQCDHARELAGDVQVVA